MIETARLTLRPLAVEDAPALQPILAQPEVASELPSIPHPLPPGGAEAWIQESSRDLSLAIVRREDDLIVGTIQLHVEQAFRRGALGGFVSREFWHDGYGAEATRGLVRYAHDELGLELVYWLRANKAYELALEEGRNGWPALRRIELETEPRRPSVRERLEARFGRG